MIIFFKSLTAFVPKKIWTRAGMMILSCIGAAITLVCTTALENIAKRKMKELDK